MRALRSLLVVVVLCALAPASAWSLTAYDQSTGMAGAVGSTGSGASSGDVTLTGLFSTTIKCNSTFYVTLASNGGGVVKFNVTAFQFANCTNSSGTACTVSVDGLPWSPTTGGLVYTSTSSVSLGMGSGGITVYNCFFGSTCRFQGAGTAAGMQHTMTGTWVNSNPQLHFSNAPVTSPCGSGSWTAAYTIRWGTNGNLVGIRDP